MYALPSHRSTRCCDITPIRHLDRLHIVGFSDGSAPPANDAGERADCACFWSQLRVLRVLHVSLRPQIRSCFAQLLGLEELHLVADLNDQSHQHQHHEDPSTAAASSAAGPASPPATTTASAGAAQSPSGGAAASAAGHVHLNAALMPRLHANGKLRLLDITGQAIGSIAADAFESLGDLHRLTVRLHRTSIVQLPGGLFYALHAVSQLSVDVSQNRRLVGLSPSVFYPNVSVWDAVGTRSIVGGLDVYGNAAMGCDCGLVWLGHWLRRWLRETAQMNVVTRDEGAAMLEVCTGCMQK